MTYGERLRGWREFRGLSRQEFANQVGVSRQTVLGWERDQWAPRSEHEPAIARVLGIPAPAPSPAIPEPPARQRKGVA